MTTPLLEVNGMCVEYRPLGASPVRVVEQAGFRLPQGGVVGLVGEGGSGKSTLSLACLGLARRSGHITGGVVRMDGRDLLALSDREWQTVRGRDLALITQNPRQSLNPLRPVGEQIELVYRTHTGASKQQAHERALEMLRLVGINDPVRRWGAYADELSGGMAQRMVIAIALVCEPRVVIADEPTSGLDVTVQAQILDDLTSSVREVGSALLLVTQDLSIVANYCDEVYLMHAGEIVEQALVAQFFDQPAHPATMALLAAQRRSTEPAFRLDPRTVDLRHRPTGCWLASRCRYVEPARCTSEHPELRQIDTDHFARCVRAEEVAAAWMRDGVTYAAR